MGDRATTRVLILGGGFTGVAAARRLERRRSEKVDVTTGPQPSVPLGPAAYFDIPKTRVASG